MEPIYTLNIVIGPEYKLQYISKNIKDIEKEILDFWEKFEQGAFTIEVKTEESVNTDVKVKKRRGRKPKAASNPGKPVQTSTKKRGRYPEEMEDYVEENMADFPNYELAGLIKKKFGIAITKPQLAAYMTWKGLKRKKGAVKEFQKTLPPIEEDDA